VLEDASMQIARDPNVKGVTAAGHDVRAIASRVHAAIVCRLAVWVQ
jgi:hypothetical protein